MKKILVALLFATALTTQSAYADFYNSKNNAGAWTVFGTPGGENNNAACVAQVDWTDGSKLQVVKDLEDGEVYLWIKNVDWNIADTPGSYELRLNFYGSNNRVAGMITQYYLINKNVVAIPNVNINTFLDKFMDNAKMNFVMPGSIQNMTVSLTGSTKAIENLVECIKVSKNAQLYDRSKNKKAVPDTQSPAAVIKGGTSL